MKKKLIAVVIIIAILVFIHLATHNMDVLGFIKRLHGG